MEKLSVYFYQYFFRFYFLGILFTKILLPYFRPLPLSLCKTKNRISKTKMKTFKKFILPPAIIFALFIGFWYLVSLVILSSRIQFILPPPHEVLTEGIFNYDAIRPTLIGLWETARVTLLGFAIAIILGIGLAILMSQARFFERMIFPYAVTLQAVPIVAIAPLIALWAGYGLKSKIIVTIIIAIFPIITNTLFGLRSVSSEMNDLFRLHVSTQGIRARFQKISKLQFRAAVPSMFAGLRIAAGLALIGTIVAEFFFKGTKAEGLGKLISDKYVPASGFGPELYTAIIITCLLGLALFWLVGRIGKYFTRYL